MAGKYDHLSKEALIAQLQDRDERQPLGLVWERDSDNIGRHLNDAPARASARSTARGGWARAHRHVFP